MKPWINLTKKIRTLQSVREVQRPLPDRPFHNFRASWSGNHYRATDFETPKLWNGQSGQLRLAQFNDGAFWLAANLCKGRNACPRIVLLEISFVTKKKCQIQKLGTFFRVLKSFLDGSHLFYLLFLGERNIMFLFYYLNILTLLSSQKEWDDTFPLFSATQPVQA